MMSDEANEDQERGAMVPERDPPPDGRLEIMKMHLDQAGQMAGYSGMKLEDAGQLFRDGYRKGSAKRRAEDTASATEGEDE